MQYGRAFVEKSLFDSEIEDQIEQIKDPQSNYRSESLYFQTRMSEIENDERSS